MVVVVVVDFVVVVVVVDFVVVVVVAVVVFEVTLGAGVVEVVVEVSLVRSDVVSCVIAALSSRKAVNAELTVPPECTGQIGILLFFA